MQTAVKSLVTMQFKKWKLYSKISILSLSHGSHDTQKYMLVMNGITQHRDTSLSGRIGRQESHDLMSIIPTVTCLLVPRTWKTRLSSEIS